MKKRNRAVTLSNCTPYDSQKILCDLFIHSGWIRSFLGSFDCDFIFSFNFPPLIIFLYYTTRKWPNYLFFCFLWCDFFQQGLDQPLISHMHLHCMQQQQLNRKKRKHFINPSQPNTAKRVSEPFFCPFHVSDPKR